MAIKYELIAKSGTYKDQTTGEDKTRWVKCGVVMDTRQGGLAAKIESLPVSWDGWLNFSEPKQKDNFKPRGDDEMPKPKKDGIDDLSEDIPF
jgi:hypothetical protein